MAARTMIPAVGNAGWLGRWAFRAKRLGRSYRAVRVERLEGAVRDDLAAAAAAAIVEG